MYQFTGLVLLLLVSGCAQTTGSDTPLGQISQAFGRQAPFDPRFTRLAKAGAPQLLIGFIDRKASGTLVLEARRDGKEIWLSPDGLSITTEAGILVATRGLGGGLLASDVSQPLAMVQSSQEGWSDRFHSYLNGEDLVVTRTYRCKIDRRGSRDLTLGNRVAKTELMRESCRSLDQSFFNLYWVEGRSGKILQTRQWAGDFIGLVSTQVVEQ